MPTLDWLNRDAAFRSADQVPYRLLQAVSTHGSVGDMATPPTCWCKATTWKR